MHMRAAVFVGDLAEQTDVCLSTKANSVDAGSRLPRVEPPEHSRQVYGCHLPIGHQEEYIGRGIQRTKSPLKCVARVGAPIG